MYIHVHTALLKLWSPPYGTTAAVIVGKIKNNNDIETYFFLTPLPYFSDLYLHSISLYMYILRSPPNFLFILPLYIKYAHHQINEHSFSIAFNTISFDIDYTFSEFGCI